MRKFFRYSLLILFLPLAILAVIAETNRSEYAGFEAPYYFVLYFLCLLVSIPLVYLWLNLCSHRKGVLSWLPVFLPVVLLVILLGIDIYHAVRKNQPVFISAGLEGLTVELRTDYTYRIISSGEFAINSYYGKFSIKGDTINLNKASEYQIEKLLIVKNTNDTLSRQGQLIEMDVNGDIVKNPLRLRIYQDKRNTL